MLSSIRVGINSGSAALERALDIPGYIPFVGSFSGAIRIKLAATQTVVAFAAGVIFLVGKLFNALSSRKISEETLGQWSQMFHDNWKNASGNYCRGFIEGIPFVNLLLIAYDMKKVKGSPIMSGLPQVSSPELNFPLLPSLYANDKNLKTTLASA